MLRGDVVMTSTPVLVTSSNSSQLKTPFSLVIRELNREDQPVFADRLLVKRDMQRLRAHQSHAVADTPGAERDLDALFPKCSFGGLGNLA